MQTQGQPETTAERRALEAIRASEAITVLPIHKGSASMVLDTADCNQKIAALLEDQGYMKLMKEPIESVVCKTILFLKKSSISEEIC
jgi:hypothetical protein